MTLTRAEQSRINGAKSRGPVTGEGKLICSMGRFVHGRRSRFLSLMTAKDREAFGLLHSDLISHYLPRTPAEHDQVLRLAIIEWKLLRIDAMELAIINHEYTLQEQALRAADSPLDPELTTALATSHIVQHSKLPQFLSRRSALLARERAVVSRELVALKKISGAVQLAQAPEVEPVSADFRLSFRPKRSRPSRLTPEAA